MAVITIRGQFGSGAPEIGRMLAMKIHGDYIDREVISEVAGQLKRKENTVAEKETPKAGLWGRIGAALARGYAPVGVPMGVPEAVNPPIPVYLPTWESPLDDTRYLKALENVIKELAATQPVVIRGRGSQFILKNYPDTTHILLVAPLEMRVKRIMLEMQLTEDAAKKEITKSDSSHREFIRRYFKADLEDATHYDLVINTGRFNYEAIVDIIVKATELKK